MVNFRSISGLSFNRYFCNEVNRGSNQPSSENQKPVLGATYYKYQTKQKNFSSASNDEKIRVSQIYIDRSSWQIFVHKCKRFGDLFIYYNRKYYYAIAYVLVFVVSHYLFVYTQKAKYGQDFPATNFELRKQKLDGTINPKYLAWEKRVDKVKEYRLENGPYV
uniref:Transmembrane protein n=1 Tax=Romanomermis culicivorax TaxID=13658 RepID=A0A915KQL3_ROMCU